MEIEDVCIEIPEVILDKKEQKSINDTEKKYPDYKDMMDAIRRSDRKKKEERDKLLQKELENKMKELKDIKEMYEIKNRLIEDYAKWVKSVDDYHQVLADHTYVYNATYHNGVYIIVLGNGKGKTLKGELKVSYCESTTQIKKKSLLFELFHN